MIRRVLASLLGLVVVLVVATSADAKMPPFDFWVDVDGQVATVTVTIGAFDDEGSPPEGFDPADLDGLLAVYPHGDVDGQGRPVSHTNARVLNLRRVEPGRYQTKVTLGKGLWSVVPFPNVSGYDPDAASSAGYPETVTFTIVAEIGLDTLVERAEWSEFVERLPTHWIEIALLVVPVVVYLGLVAVGAFLLRRRLENDAGRLLIPTGAAIVAFVALVWVYSAASSYVGGLPDDNEIIPNYRLWVAVGVGLIYTTGLGLAALLGHKLLRSRHAAIITTSVVLLFMLITLPITELVLGCIVEDTIGISLVQCG